MLDEWKKIDNSDTIIFNFNKGILLNALKKGYVVIWDSVEQARAEVIEKCNSLGE